MDPSRPIVFYDIASGPPVRTFAPNPWKTRYALNFKGVHYKTAWVDLPDVKATRMKLGAAPNRVLPDGSDFYTLPVIQDLSNNNEVVGDTFDIAVYLDKIYPDGPTLLTASSPGLYKAFNAQVDAIFTDRILLFVQGMPFNPETADQSKKIFEGRTNGLAWEDITVKGDARMQMFASLQEALEGLMKSYKICGGPYLDGEICSYADIILGAWLQMAKATLVDKEWSVICSWHGGMWGRLVTALDKYAAIV